MAINHHCPKECGFVNLHALSRRLFVRLRIHRSTMATRLPCQRLLRMTLYASALNHLKRGNHTLDRCR